MLLVVVGVRGVKAPDLVIKDCDTPERGPQNLLESL